MLTNTIVCLHTGTYTFDLGAKERGEIVMFKERSLLENAVLRISYKHLFLAGMCLQAFVEAFFCLAQKKYKSLPLHEQVASLIDFCEYHLAALDEKRLVCGRGIVERRSAVVPCQTDGLHLTPAAHPPLLNRTAAAGKFADYRNHRY